MRTEYKGDNGLEIRCHPGYRGGSPWYDWVEVELPNEPIDERLVPFKVLAVVPIRREGCTTTKFEFIGQLGTKRTHNDSAMFTEWQFEMNYTVLPVECVARPIFVVTVAALQLSVMRSIAEWPACFIDTS